MSTMDSIFDRTELILGAEALERLRSRSVILFGVGGVGSWCAEALVRSGIGSITIVDFDRVSVSNINRQLPATSATVGLPKVEVMLGRLKEINPNAHVEALQEMFTAENAHAFGLGGYDYVIDAIDSVPHKASLILSACQAGARLYSSMGAALKTDPSRVAVAEFWKVKGCPLAAALRHRFRRTGEYPSKRFKCVYSDQLAANRLQRPVAPGEKPVNGSLVHMTAIFGFTLASLVVNDCQTPKNPSH